MCNHILCSFPVIVTWKGVFFKCTSISVVLSLLHVIVFLCRYIFFSPQIFCSEFVEHPHSMTEVLSLWLKMNDNKHESSSPAEKQTARLRAYCDVLEVSCHIWQSILLWWARKRERKGWEEGREERRRGGGNTLCLTSLPVTVRRLSIRGSM